MPTARKLTWWLLRHASIDPAFHGRIVGQTDVAIAPLTSREPLGPELSGKPEWIVTPLQRTQQTAWALGASDWRMEPAFQEQHFGAWELERWSELVQSDARAAAFLQDYSHVRPPGGESLTDVSKRCIEAFERLTRETQASHIIAVVHSGVIRSLLAHVLDIPLSSVLKLTIDPLSVSVIECWGSERQVLGVNWKPISVESFASAPTARD